MQLTFTHTHTHAITRVCVGADVGDVETSKTSSQIVKSLNSINSHILSSIIKDIKNNASSFACCCCACSRRFLLWQKCTNGQLLFLSTLLKMFAQRFKPLLAVFRALFATFRALLQHLIDDRLIAHPPTRQETCEKRERLITPTEHVVVREWVIGNMM